MLFIMFTEHPRRYYDGRQWVEDKTKAKEFKHSFGQARSFAYNLKVKFKLEVTGVIRVA